MVNFRQIFLAIACSALLWAAHTQAATVSSAAATKRAMVLASFCAPDGDKAAALEQLVEVGISSDAQDRAWARQIVGAIRNGSLACSAHAHATLNGSPALDAIDLQPAAHAAVDTSDVPYVPSIVMMRKLVVASAEMDLMSGTTG